MATSRSCQQSPSLDTLETGINGLEVYYPEHSDKQIEKYLQLSREHHLLVTGGSDYHGLNQSESRSRLGAAGINQELMQKIKAFNASNVKYI